MASEQYIKTKLDKYISQDILVPCLNLSTILGDLDGKVSRSTGRSITSTVSIIPPGMLVSASNFGSMPQMSGAIPREVFTPDVSPRCVSTYNSLSLNDGTLTILDGDASTTITSPLLQQSTSLSLELTQALSVIYLESFSLYLELLEATQDDGLPSMTIGDLSRVDGNIRWLSDQLDEDHISNFDLMLILRDLQRNISFIKYTKYLFTQTYDTKLKNFNTLGGE